VTHRDSAVIDLVKTIDYFDLLKLIILLKRGSTFRDEM